MNDIRFIERKPNGQFDIALGTDSVVSGVSSRSKLSTIHRKALAQAKRLRRVQPRYVGYSMTGMKPVYFTPTELASLETET